MNALPRQLGCSPTTVRLWRTLWAAALSILAVAEALPHDLAALIATVLADAPRSGAPDAVWVFLSDQLNTHQSESLVRLVAQRCLIADDLGVKGETGVLQSLATRAAFLSDPAHRIQFVYVPKHTSWLNQVEIWFSILVRRVIKGGTFTSQDDLRAKIRDFIAYFNQTAKPFAWTYTGRPLVI